jgi:hypothetical protein
VGLGFELKLRTLCLQTMYSIMWVHTSSTFCSGYFGDGDSWTIALAGLKQRSLQSQSLK